MRTLLAAIWARTDHNDDWPLETYPPHMRGPVDPRHDPCGRPPLEEAPREHTHR